MHTSNFRYRVVAKNINIFVSISNIFYSEIFFKNSTRFSDVRIASILLLRFFLFLFFKQLENYHINCFGTYSVYLRELFYNFMIKKKGKRVPRIYLKPIFVLVSLYFLKEMRQKGEINIRTLTIVPQGAFDFQAPNIAVK